jgi:YfiH family protein
MGWTWNLEDDVFVLRHRPLPRGIADFGVAGRAIRAGAPDPLPVGPRVRPAQVHGTTVRDAEAPGDLPSCDAVFTRVPGLVITVRVADCLPVLLASPGGPAALVHAGWRGLAAGVLEAALDRFPRPRELHALLGPAIGPCCFEVGPEVAARFPPGAVRRRLGRRPHVDLFTAARLRLLRAGVPASGVSVPAPCTRCHQHLLHSHRGSGGAPGRNTVFAVVGDSTSPQQSS